VATAPAPSDTTSAAIAAIRPRGTHVWYVNGGDPDDDHRRARGARRTILYESRPGSPEGLRYRNLQRVSKSPAASSSAGLQVCQRPPGFSPNRRRSTQNPQMTDLYKFVSASSASSASIVVRANSRAAA